MNTISEQNFKIVLDMSWTAFAKSVGLINTLADIGLDVTGDTSGSMTKFHELYAIQDKVSSTILNILGIDSKQAPAFMNIRHKKGVNYGRSVHSIKTRGYV